MHQLTLLCMVIIISSVHCCGKLKKAEYTLVSTKYGTTCVYDLDNYECYFNCLKCIGSTSINCCECLFPGWRPCGDAKALKNMFSISKQLIGGETFASIFSESTD